MKFTTHLEFSVTWRSRPKQDSVHTLQNKESTLGAIDPLPTLLQVLPKEQVYMDFLIAVIAELRAKASTPPLQWYLAHQKPPTRRTLQ
jgi:hypothetical protein